MCCFMILIKTAWQRKLRKISKNKTEIWSVFKTEICDKVCADIGPLEFVNLILNAEAVVSNSFHATAFAIIFHKEFL